MDGSERDRTLEARIDALETRFGPLERAVAKLLTAQIEAGQATTSGAAAPPAAQPHAAIAGAPVAATPIPTMPPIAPVTATPTVPPIAPVTTTPALGALPTPAEETPPGSTEPVPWAAPTAAPRWQAPAPTSPQPWQLPEPTSWVPSVPMPSVNLRATLVDLEERMAGRALAVVGGVAIVLGAILFLGLAFSQGWIGNEARVALGLIGGSAGLAIGAILMERGNRLLGHVLTPIGLAIITISLVAATQLYDLFPVPAGLTLALFAAVVTAIVAVRADSQLVAGFGLVAVLVAPPLLGATPDLVTLAFIGVALVGTTAIALWRTWAWLPPLAFALSAPQAASWLLGETNVAFGLVGLGAFTILQAVAAGGEEFRRRRDDLSPSSATLLLGSAAFLVWGGFVLLDGDLVAYRATFLIVAALAYLGLGAYFIVRDGDRHLFGLLTAATGIGALTMAAPIGLGAPAVPVAWTAEAAVLAWVAVRRPHPYSALVSGGLYVATSAWLVYSVFLPGIVPGSTVPFAHGGGVALATFLAGLAAGIVIVPNSSARRALAGLGLATAGWCALVELSGPPVVGAEIWLAVVGAALIVGLPLLATRGIDWRPDGPLARVWPSIESLAPAIRPLIPVVATLVGAVATVHLLALELVLEWSPAESGIPFIGSTGLTVAVYLAALVAICLTIRSWVLRQSLAALGLLVMIPACVAELSGPPVVAALMALVVVGSGLRFALPELGRAVDPGSHRTRIGAWKPRARRLLPAVMLLAGSVATAHVYLVELVSDWAPPASGVPFVGDVGLTLVAYLGALAAVGWLERNWALRQALTALGLLVTAVTCSAELEGVALVAAWAALAVLGLALWRLLAVAASRAGAGEAFVPLMSAASLAATGTGAGPWRRLLVGNVLRVAAVLVAGAAVAYTLGTGLPPQELASTTLPAVPFNDAGAAMGAILATAAVLAGLTTGGAIARRAGILLAGVAVAYTIPFQVEPWAVAVLWSVLAIAAFVAARLDAEGVVPYLVAGWVTVGLAAADAILVVAPPTRLVVAEVRLDQLYAIQSLLALVLVGAALGTAIALFRTAPWARGVEIAVGLLAVYTVSIAVVDVFATQVGGATSLDELRWQSQAALSVAWAIMGMVAFVVGLRFGRAELRVGGLLLLGVTTLKVFVLDLAGLDIAYKVVALIGLGIVLLVSAGLWQRLHIRPPRAPQGPAAVQP